MLERQDGHRHTYPKSSREVDFQGDFLMTSRDETMVSTDNKWIYMKETYREKPRRLFSRWRLNRASIRVLCRKKGVLDGVSLGQDQEPIM